MNPREKMMIAILGGLLALLAGYTVKNQYAKKLKSLDSEIAKRQRELKDIDFEQEQLRRGKIAWSEAGRQTLAVDAGQAQTLFRPDIDALVQEVGLRNGVVQLKGLGGAGRNGSSKNGLRALRCTVTAEGKLEQILDFLFRLHQRSYVVRCEELSLSQLVGRNAPKDFLQMTVHLDTLLMPDGREVGLPRVIPVDITSRPAEPVVRTAMARLKDYADIVERKIFEPWEPPIPPPAKVVGHNPPNSGKLNLTSPTLNWHSAANAKSYDVFFGDANPPPKMATLTAISYRINSPLQEEKTYYWKVDSINQENVRTEGDVVEFTAYRPTVPPPKVEDRPPPPPPDANLTLARIVSSPRGAHVVLEDPDPRNKGAEDKRVEVGDTLYDGILVFVHPKGAVSQKDDKLRYHPLTRPLRECEPLTIEAQPELFDAVMQLKLEERATGISRGPG